MSQDYDPKANPENHPWSDINRSYSTALDPSLAAAAQEAVDNGLFGGTPDIELILQMIEAATGIDITELPVLGDIVEALTGVEDGDYSDIGSFVALLFGRDSALASRVSKIEGKIAVGAEFFDDFNRGDSGSAIGNGFTQGGSGQGMGIHDQAVQLVRDPLPASGRRYAICPQVTSGDDVTVAAVIHPRGTPPAPATSLFCRANATLTEFIFVNLFGGKCYLGRGTRSGNTWNFSDWKSDLNRSYSNSSTVELKADGTHYQVVIDGVLILDHNDVSGYPVDVSHRHTGFAMETWTAILAVPQFSGGLASYAVRSSTELNAVATAQLTAGNAATTATNAQTTAQNAQTAADNAVSDAVDQATAAIEPAIVEILAPVQNAVSLLQSTAPTKPYYETMNKTQDVTFPRFGLNSAPKKAATSSGAVDPFANRVMIDTGDADGGRDWYTSFTPAYLPTLSQVDGAFIPATYPGPRATVTFIAEAYSGSIPLQVIVGRMKSNGNAVLEWVSPNQTPLMPTSRVEWTVTMPEDLLFDVGENMWVAIHQYSVSGTPREIFGMEYADIPRGGDIYPPQAKFTIASSVSLSSFVGQEFAASGLVFTSRFVPWLAIGQRFSTLVVGRNFSDPFTDPMSSRWVQKSSTPATISSGYFTVSGSTDGVRRYLWHQPLATDDGVVEGKIGTGLNSRFLRLIMKSNSANTQYLALTVNSSSVDLDRVISESHTALASVSLSPGNGDSFRVVFIGNTFQVERKLSNSSTWNVLFTFVDSTAAVPTGEGYRYVGLGVERQVFVNSANWDSWSAFDQEI